MPSVPATVRRGSQWFLRRFKAAARRLVVRTVRKTPDRYEALESRQARLEAFRWDHVALSRRLAAIEDHVEMLLRQQPSSDESMDQTDLPAVVPMAPADAHRAAGGRTLRRRAQA